MPGREAPPRAFSAPTLTALYRLEALGLGWIQALISGTQTLGDPPPRTMMELPPLLQAGTGETLWGGPCMRDQETERVPGGLPPTLLSPKHPTPHLRHSLSSESSLLQKKATAQVRSLSMVLLSPWSVHAPHQTRMRPASVAATASQTPSNHSGL